MKPFPGRLGIVVAARTGSRRLPGKALLPLAGLPMLVFLLRRLRGTRHADALLLATTDLPEDDVLVDLAHRENVPVHRGEEDDVVARFVGAAEAFDLQWVARVTADCPFLNAAFMDYCITRSVSLLPCDLVSTKTRFPIGIDVEIYNAARMAEAHALWPRNAAYREHLTKNFYDTPEMYTTRYIDPPVEWRPVTGLTYTVDTPDDYAFAQRVVEACGDAADLSLTDILKVI